MAYASATGYDPDGTMRQLTSAPGMGGGVPPGQGSMLDPAAINGLMAYKMNLAAQQQAQENDRSNRALSLQEWMAHNAQAEHDQSRMDAREHASPPPQFRGGTPVFTKTVGGAGITPGTIRLNQWEPGAAFSGYAEDLGQGPANATMSTAAGQSQAASRGLAANEWQQFQEESARRQKVPAYGARG